MAAPNTCGVDLLESQVTLLAAKVDQTLEILPFVLLLHAS